MAKDEAKVRVRLDTRLAQLALRKLKLTAKDTGKRIGSGIRRELGRGIGAVGLGGGIGLGLAAVRGATQSGFGDAIGESLGGIGAQLAEFFLGDLDEKARATKSAREETIAAFGSIAGQRGEMPAGARSYFEQIKALRMHEEKGREIFERDEKMRGPGIDEIIKKILEGLKRILKELFEWLKDQINPFN